MFKKNQIIIIINISSLSANIDKHFLFQVSLYQVQFYGMLINMHILTFLYV